jgi:hypothetical protein
LFNLLLDSSLTILFLDMPFSPEMSDNFTPYTVHIIYSVLTPILYPLHFFLSHLI